MGLTLRLLCLVDRSETSNEISSLRLVAQVQRRETLPEELRQVPHRRSLARSRLSDHQHRLAQLEAHGELLEDDERRLGEGVRTCRCGESQLRSVRECDSTNFEDEVDLGCSSVRLVGLGSVEPRDPLAEDPLGALRAETQSEGEDGRDDSVAVVRDGEGIE